MASHRARATQALQSEGKWDRHWEWMFDVGNPSDHPWKLAIEDPGNSTWKPSRNDKNEGNRTKLCVVEWTRQGYWRESQILLEVSRNQSDTCCSTITPLGMAYCFMEESSYRFRRSVLGENVFLMWLMHTLNGQKQYLWQPSRPQERSKLCKHSLLGMVSLNNLFQIMDLNSPLMILHNLWELMVSSTYAVHPIIPHPMALLKGSSRHSKELWKQETKMVRE